LNVTTHQKISQILSSLTIILAFLLSACGSSEAPPATMDINAVYTQAAATIAVQLTQTALAMPTATSEPPTSTPEPSAALQPSPTGPASTPTITILTTSSQPTPVPSDPAAAFGCYNATFVADVNVFNGSNFKPGDKFTKTWRVKNTGSCDWNRGFLIAFISGDKFGSETKVIDQKVPAGGIAEISLAMVAPSLSGSVSSYWRIATDIGKPFGDVLGVTITLPAAAVTTPTGCYNSELVSDVTIPSGTEFKPGDKFTKTWRIKNTGTCDWSNDYKITFIGGDLFGSDTTKIRQKVGAGSTAEISLAMVAPSGSGQVTSSWQLATDDGELFGQIFTVVIVLK
jgi:hypothetical protein